jgi:hypothetical protein
MSTPLGHRIYLGSKGMGDNSTFGKRMVPEAVEGPIRETRVTWRRLDCLNPRVHTVKTSGWAERLQPQLFFECWRREIGSSNDIVEGMGGNESPQGPERGRLHHSENVHHDRKAGLPTGREPYGDGDPIVVAGVTPRHGEWESHSQGEVGQVQKGFPRPTGMRNAEYPQVAGNLS